MPWKGTIFTSQILGKTSLIADYVTKVLRPCGKASIKVMFYFRTAMLSSKELILSHRKTAATGGSNAMSQYWKEAVLLGEGNPSGNAFYSPAEFASTTALSIRELRMARLQRN